MKPCSPGLSTPARALSSGSNIHPICWPHWGHTHTWHRSHYHIIRPLSHVTSHSPAVARIPGVVTGPVPHSLTSPDGRGQTMRMIMWLRSKIMTITRSDSSLTRAPCWRWSQRIRSRLGSSASPRGRWGWIRTWRCSSCRGSGGRAGTPAASRGQPPPGHSFYRGQSSDLSPIWNKTLKY